MDNVIHLLITVSVAFAGGMFFKKIHMLTPMLTGSIIAVAAVTLIFPGSTWFPVELKTLVQMVSGAVIGSRVSRKEIHELKSLIIPAVTIVLCLMVLNVVSAIGMLHAGIDSIPTAMFASAPGGMSDMTIMSPDFGADPIYVAVIQFCRLLFVNTTFPALIKFVDRRKLYPGEARQPIPRQVYTKADEHSAPLWSTAIFTLCGGCLFRILGIPSGAILGSALFVALQNVKYERIAMPPQVSWVAQAGIGCYIGVQMVRESLRIIANAAFPVLVLLVASLIYTYLCAMLLYRISRFDFTTCMLMCSPGGLNEMSIIADEMGADAPKVAVMHSVRILCIVAFFYNLIDIIEFIVY